MRVGAQLYTVRDYCKTIEDIRETCKKVAGIGYTAVQISGFGPANPSDVAQAMEDAGLAVAATHMGWERFTNDLDALIAEHKTWKCPHPAIGGLPGEYHSAEGVARFIEELTPVAARLAEEGMDFSYHNHNQELIKYGDKTWLAQLYEQAPGDVCKAEIDTYWIAAGGGDPAAWIEKCAGRQPLVHFKDMAMAAGREQRFAPIGEGNLNWPRILKACEKGGVEEILVEQDQCYDLCPFDALAVSYKNLSSWGLS
ncbi:MAG TPA: sugar phosphate isomerase/epimerase [Armatimonadota bacterium]|jgi:sugar phosphate isomerase/epimerase|nr:sugar phosphate isomerase/epimerase [Armatimonadota bacterium]